MRYARKRGGGIVRVVLLAILKCRLCCGLREIRQESGVPALQHFLLRVAWLYPSVGLVATLLGLGYVLIHVQGLTPLPMLFRPTRGLVKYEM